MPELQRPAINPEYLRLSKDTIFSEWKHLPPEHQATTALVLLAEVLSGQYGTWLREAIRFQDVDPMETISPEAHVIPASLHPDHFRDLPIPFQPESESGQAVVHARLYLPGSHRLWYPSAFDGKDLFFGLVVEAEISCDYFSLSDLAQLRGPDGQPIQHDSTYIRRSLDDLVAQYERGLSLQTPDH